MSVGKAICSRVGLLVLGLALAQFAGGEQSAEAPVQPVPYSHKFHAGTLKLACNSCHLNPDPGEIMGIPQASRCMECHKSVKAASPHIQKLAGYAERGEEVPWARVYQIPGYVFFSHRAHLETGAACGTCHGPVAEREALFRETDISMGGCMNCHRKNKASLDCGYCHEPRN